MTEDKPSPAQEANTMQSEESNTLVKLAKAVIEHAPEGGDAFWGIKFSDIEAALSAAEPVMNNAGPKCEPLERSCTFDPDNDPKKENVYAAPPAPSVAVKALQAAEEELSRIDCIPMVTETSDTYAQLELAKVYAGRGAHEARKALAALSEQVQDVAKPDFSYRIEYDYRSYVEKKTMWGLYRELGVVALEEAQEALRTAQQNNAGNFRISRKPVVKWEPLPAAPAKQEGGHD